MTTKNWVADRAACRIDHVFKDLRNVIEHDITEVNALAEELQLWTFEAVEKGDKLIVKPLRDAGSSTNEQFVAFEKRENDIRVFGLLSGGLHPRVQLPELLITPQWDDEKCSRILLIDGQPHELWQISKRALEGLFVPSWRPQ